MGQFGALMRKNWILYRRGCFCNLLEIIIPTSFYIIILFFSRISPPEYIREQSFYNTSYKNTFNYDSLPSLMTSCPNNSTIALAPSSNFMISIIHNRLQTINLTSQLYGSQQQIQDFIRSSTYSSSTQICWAIISQKQPNKYQYKLRFNTSKVGLNNIGPQTSASPLTLDTKFDLNSYQSTVNSRKLLANYLVNSIIFQLELGSNNSIEQQIFPAYQQQLTKDTIYQNLYRWIDLICLIPLLIVYTRQSFFMLCQKQTKVRQSMIIIGNRMKIWFLTWFIRYFVIYCIIHCVAVVIMKFQLPYVPFYIPLILFILFDALIIVQNFFVLVFFSNAKRGTAFSFLFFLLQYSICYLVSNTNPGERYKTFLSVVPHVAFVFAFQNLFYFQSQKVAASFFQSINSYTLMTAFISFTANIIFYLIILYYFNQIIPNQWGKHKNPCFCFCCKKVSHKRLQSFNKKKMDYSKRLDTTEDIIEMVSYNQIEGNFSQEKKTYLKLYNNQIFVLYGHNRSGKTTVIQTLSGIIQQDNSWVSIFGTNNIDEIQKILGFCPQHNIICQQLTVKEQLSLFADLKQIKSNQLQTSIRNIMADFELIDKQNQFTKNLKQQDKRLLSIATAFVGNSKFIILDEPTCGLDAIKRQRIWDLLHIYKRDRVIIVTSHLIEQAEYFADRVGIMKDGKLLCCGSTAFLKESFGVAYKVTFAKNSRHLKTQKIIEMVKRQIPNALVLYDKPSVIAINLPLRQIKLLSDLLQQIDIHKSSLGIIDYGINITSLQEIIFDTGLQNSNDEGEIMNMDCKTFKGNFIPFILQLRAISMKRLAVIKNDFKTLTLQFLLPLLVIIGTCFFIKQRYIHDFLPQTVNFETYLSQQNPIIMPISSNYSTPQSVLNSQYGTNINIYRSNFSVYAFDKQFLFPLKNAHNTLKGGIVFKDPIQTNSTRKQFISALCITKSPTSYLFLPTFATQTILNYRGRNISITVVDHPLPLTFDQLSIGTVVSGFLAAFLLILAFAFKFASTVSFIVRQRTTEIKSFQVLNGMKISAYWMGNFIFDYLLYLSLAGVTIFLCYYVNVQFLSGNILPITIYLFVSFGMVYIPLTYILAFCFKSHARAESICFFFTVFMGGLLPGLTFALRFISAHFNQIGRLIAWFLRLHPAFAFGQAIVNLSSVNVYKKFQNNYKIIEPFSVQISIAPLGYLVGGFILQLFMLAFIETCSKENQSCCDEPNKIQQNYRSIQISEMDVKHEQYIAENAEIQKYAIVSKKLIKIYRTSEEAVINNISLAIQKGELLGLLGTRNAGKSTLIKMLMGVISPTSGRAIICGKQITKAKTFQKVGYCPQNDALVEELTVREQLQFFYYIRSIKYYDKDQYIDNVIFAIGLKEFQHSISSTLSRGNKRKLSVAIAILAKPQILLLDQPSVGMDPAAKKAMWKAVSKIIKKGKSTIILATNSLQEAEDFSSRLAIIHKGSLKCIENPWVIKRKYGDGIEIEIKLKSQNIEKIIKDKKLQKVEIRNKFKLKQMLEKLSANQYQKRQVYLKDQARDHLYQASKTRPAPIHQIISYQQSSYIFEKIWQTLKSQYKQIQFLSRRKNWLKLKINKKPKISELFSTFEQFKQLYGIQQYKFKQISFQEIFKHSAFTK